ATRAAACIRRRPGQHPRRQPPFLPRVDGGDHGACGFRAVYRVYPHRVALVGHDVPHRRHAAADRVGPGVCPGLRARGRRRPSV
ncbi:MAG: hypothetical protein AVDCRST_MAG27-892, partial [uncultured Craurococcus sp.]